MYILKVVVQGMGETLMFRFKQKSVATSFRADLDACVFRDNNDVTLKHVLVEDDFGLSIKIPYYSVILVELIDFEKAVEGDATWQFMQQKLGSRTLDKLKAGSPIITPTDPGFPGTRRI